MKKVMMGLFITILLLISGLGAASTVFSQVQQGANSKITIETKLDPTQKSQELEMMGLEISTDNGWYSFSSNFGGNAERFYLAFEPPRILDTESYSHIIVPESNYFNLGGAPMVPKRTLTFTFPPGTEILNVNFNPQLITPQLISKPVFPAPYSYPIVEGYTENINPEPQMDDSIYKSDNFYPEAWFEYSTGLGLSPKSNERELFLVLQIYPVRFNPVKNEIHYFTTGELEIQIQEPTLSTPTRATETRAISHDMVIICPNDFKNDDLKIFADRKTATGVDSIIITTSEITGGTFFPTSTTFNRDLEENIKYFIYNAVKEWNIKYVLLIGDHDEIPTRRTHVDDSWPDSHEGSDLYYADVLDSSNNFCDWNYDNDEYFGEYHSGNTDRADLYPDVNIGRFPASNVGQLATLIDKTVNYEYTAIGQEWFKTAILCGMDTFSGGTPEGEYLSDYIASHYLEDYNVIKLYETQNTLSTAAIKTNMNDGAGFTSFSDHGTHGAWGGSQFDSSDMKSLTNGNKLPFVNFDACLTGEFDQGSSDCLAEETILNSIGGGIAVVASSRVAYGSWGASHINTASGYLNIRLYHNFQETSQVAGEMLTNAKIDYLRNVGSSGSVNFKTIVEYNYFGDPSLLLGGLPTAIFNVKCDNNKTSVEPGKSTEYRLQVENTDIQSRQIKLSLEDIPKSWDAIISEKSLFLDSNRKSNITLTISAPTDALAGFQAKIKVIAQLANIQRTLSVETKTTVARIYGFDILSNKKTNASGSMYPGKIINFTFQVNNYGNSDDTVTLDLRSLSESGLYWENSFSPSQASLLPFSQQEVKLLITIPTKTVAETYDFEVKGKLLGNGKTKTLDISIEVIRVFGVNLTCSGPELSSDPGINVSFKLSLSNEGNHLESFLLTVPNLPQNWVVNFQTTKTINDTFEVNAFSELLVNAVFYVPSGTIVGEYNLTVITQCVGIEFVVCSNVDLILEVNRVYGILLTTLNPEIQTNPGEGLLQFLQLLNLGNDIDSADIEIINYPENWRVAIDSQYNILLSPNGRRTIGFRITPYEQEIVGTYNVNLRATLAGDNSMSDLRLSVIIDRIYDLNISNLDEPMNISAGATTNVPVIITNLGNDKDSVKLSLPEQIHDCTVTLKDPDPVSLKAYGSKEVELEITSERNTIAGEKIIPIRAMLESNGENYTFNYIFNINSYHGVELSSDKSAIHTQPGNEIKFDISIQNTGNSEDTFTFLIEEIPPHWTINFPKRESITIKPFGTTNRTLYIRVPSDEPYHNVDMEVRIVSTSDSKANARLQLTTSIEEEKLKVMGMEIEMFGILILVLVVIIILIAIGLVRRRRKRKNEIINIGAGGTGSSPLADSRYTTSSDGSRVEWVDSSQQALPVQYNPPTPAAEGQLFELQVMSPKTYRNQTYIRSTTQQQPSVQPYPTQTLEVLPQYDYIPGLPPATVASSQPRQDGLEFKPPRAGDDQLTPELQEQGPKMAGIDDFHYSYSDAEEAAMLEQLDAELAMEAETLAMEEVEADTLTEQDKVEIMEYHDSDEFSLDFKRPEQENNEND